MIEKTFQTEMMITGCSIQCGQAGKDLSYKKLT